jgi:ketosteroid isomerase-like protein
MASTEERLKALEDEKQIRALAASFAEACTSGDAERFASLWTVDSAWLLGTPLALESWGRESNVKLFAQLGEGKRFFCQLLHSGTVTVSGNTATARWILSERAAGHDGSLYQSLATYDDQLIYEAGEWLFKERCCQFLDLTHAPGPE